MSTTPILPDDPQEYRKLLVETLRCRDELLRRNDGLQRVLDQTAADFSDLRERHAGILEELALFRRYVFGPRRERIVNDPGQRHLFELEDVAIEPVAPAPVEPETTTNTSCQSARPHERRSLDHPPLIRIEHNLPEAAKTCSCCGGLKTRIGEDLSSELEFTPKSSRSASTSYPNTPARSARTAWPVRRSRPSPYREGSPARAWSRSCW
ncbi:MAG: hypothetical protein K1X67_20270 [Fimbriimonadaceae bacterium]|nr:hypothetical protein [Fimbriimonadaceae bacterium]